MAIHHADNVFIVTTSAARGEEILSMLSLRGFDEVKLLSFEQAAPMVVHKNPDLLIIDPEGTMTPVLALLQDLKSLPAVETAPSLMLLAEQFDEDQFLTFHDAGVREYLVKPLNSAYLVSRVLAVLDDRRLKANMNLREKLLQELSVFTRDSGVFTAEYFKRMIAMSATDRKPPKRLGLVLLTCQGQPALSTLENTFRHQITTFVAEALKVASRSSDVIGSLGPDTFALMLFGTGLDGCEQVTVRLTRSLHGVTLHSDDGRQSVELMIRLGVSDNSNHETPEALLSAALQNLTTTSRP